jgi:serine-type anaerobic sulfatase-maturating enzyme
MTARPTPPEGAVRDRLPFHVMAKPTGARCNLDCDYCFFLTKAKLYPGSSRRMDDRTQ